MSIFTNVDVKKNDCPGKTFYIFVPKKESTLQKVVLSDKTISVNSQSDVARINAASNVYLNANALLNDASLIYAKNNLFLTGDVLSNKSYQSGTLRQYLNYQYEGADFWLTGGVRRTIYTLAKEDQSIYIKADGNTRNDDGIGYDYVIFHDSNHRDGGTTETISITNSSLKFILTGEPVIELINGQSYNATIQAGGAITANFSQNISNTGLQPGSGGFIPAIATPTLSGVTALTPAGAQADRGLRGGSASPVSGSALSGTGGGRGLVRSGWWSRCRLQS
ncbi:hypothetical protein, partial [Dickeya oryzae]